MTNGFKGLTGNYMTIQYTMTDPISIGAYVVWQTQVTVDPPPVIETTPEPVTDMPTTAPPKDKGGRPFYISKLINTFSGSFAAVFTLSSLLITVMYLM